jgi:hypothetical protein
LNDILAGMPVVNKRQDRPVGCVIIPEDHITVAVLIMEDVRKLLSLISEIKILGKKQL